MLIVRFASRAVRVCGPSLLLSLVGCAAPAAAGEPAAQRAMQPGAQLAAHAAAQPRAQAAAQPVRPTDVADLAVRVTAGSEPLDPARVSVDWTSLDRRTPDDAQETGTATASEADGLWHAPNLPYGKYELSVRYADGLPRVRRISVDAPEERIDVDVPHGRIVMRSGQPVHELLLRNVSLRQGTAVRTWEETTEPEFVAEGLSPGRYIVRATFPDGAQVLEHVRLSDAQAEVVVNLQPVPTGELRLALKGWSELDDTESFIIEAYAQTPEDRMFDFGAPVAARSAPPRTKAVALQLPPGRYGLLIASRSSVKGRTGMLAFLPDIVTLPGAPVDETADLATPRRVLVRGAGGEITPADFGFRFGADMLPAHLVTRTRDAWRSDGVMLPTRDCAVVAGGTRRLVGAEGGTVAPVLPGTGPQEIELELK